MHRRAAHPGETGGTGRSIRTDLAMEAAEAAILTAEDIEKKAVARGGARARPRPTHPPDGVTPRMRAICTAEYPA